MLTSPPGTMNDIDKLKLLPDNFEGPTEKCSKICKSNLPKPPNHKTFLFLKLVKLCIGGLQGLQEYSFLSSVIIIKRSTF